MSDFDLLAESNVKTIASKKPAEGYMNLECNLNEAGTWERVEGTVALGEGKFQNKDYKNLMDAATAHYQKQIDAGVKHEDCKKLYVTLRASVFVPATMQQSKADGKLSVEQILALQESA